MDWTRFHHPDFCPLVARRRLTLEIIDLLDGVGTLLATRGRSFGWNESYPSRAAYYAAQHRLRKAGLIAYRRSGGRTAALVLTPEGRKRLPEVVRPQRYWDRKWNRRWYVLAYDVPETERTYRNVLRRFLKRMRMGCLQGSVWVSPHDIRPEYEDLSQAAGVAAYSYLFESRMVLGRSDSDVVRDGWDMDAVRESHSWYCDVCKDNLDRIRGRSATGATLTNLLREEMSAYLQIMDGDPLLPRPLWPPDYMGETAYELHRALQAELGRRL